jgi:hypothetical protein
MGLGAVVVSGMGLGAGLLIGGVWLPSAIFGAVANTVSAAEAIPFVSTEVTTAEMTESNAVSEEIPEEILRTEIITEARSPLNGELLNATEYAQLEAQLAEPAGGNLVSEDLRHLIYLLQIRRAFKPILPFIK